MQILHGLPSHPPPVRTLLAIGNFDGVHRGHQALISEMKRVANECRCWSGVLTFDPHPLAILAPERPLAVLSTLEERMALLSALNLDFAVIYPFTLATAQTPARLFVSHLSKTINLAQLWVGPDATLGDRQSGDVAALSALGEDLGFEVRVVSSFCMEGGSVRSTRIRTLLQEGDVRTAARLLGRPFRLTGYTVVALGDGSAPGSSTLSLAVETGRVLPGEGIYAGWLDADVHHVPAVFGVTPPPNRGRSHEELRVEVRPVDRDAQFRGQVVSLTFVEQLRRLKDFERAGGLAAQLARDLAAARRILLKDSEEV